MDQASQIREKIDIVAFISEFIPLKKMGRNFTAVCPFHNEKSPSFVVSPERQIWHCFGCGKGGDCFTFLMEYEKIEFIEALRILARKTGVELKSGDFAGASKKEKIYKINKSAADFYNFVLTKHSAGKKALEYLKNRGITGALIESFGLGFAPSNNSLADYLLKKKNYQKQDLIEGGLVFQRERIFDFFKNRIIFPLTDQRGNILGFSGRVLEETENSGPKYINTKETIAYHKGSTFFAVNKAIDEIKKTKEVLIMEGEFDVISSFKEGITNAVAIKGTALTEEQAMFISRFAQKVILCLDQDDAGIEATKRSIEILEKKGLSSYVIALKDKDPDEAIKQDPIAFKKALKESVGVYDFLISDALKKFDKKTIEGKKKISEYLLLAFSKISNEIVKEHYLKKLSIELDTSLESINKQLEKIDTKGNVKEISNEEKDKRTRKEVLEEYLLSLIIQSEKPKILFEDAMKILKDYVFETDVFGKIIEKLVVYFKNNDNFESKHFLENLPKELVDGFDKAFLLPLAKFENFEKTKEEIKKVATELKRIFLKNKIQEISDLLKNPKLIEDSKDQDNLKEKLPALTKELSALS